MNESIRGIQREEINKEASQAARVEAIEPGPILIDGMPDFTEVFTFKAGGRTWGLCWDCRQKVQFSGDQLARHVRNRPDHIKRQLLPLGEKALSDIYENLDEHLANTSVVLVKKKGINIRNAGRRSKEKEFKQTEAESGPKPDKQARTSKDQVPHS